MWYSRSSHMQVPWVSYNNHEGPDAKIYNFSLQTSMLSSSEALFKLR
jgi:hypothetical protein